MTLAGSLALVCNHPLFGLALTLLVYIAADRLHAAMGSPPLLHPILLSIAIVAGAILVLPIDYARYFEQAEPLHFGLGVLVVLLAVPLFRQAGLIRVAGRPLAVALGLGAAIGLGTAIGFPLSLGAPDSVVVSMAPKSATTAVAVGVAERAGGVIGLTAMTVVLTGLFGAVAGPALLTAFGIHDERAAGFALGVAAHGIGTARAFQISETAGAFASVGMILHALLTVLLVPLALRFA